MSTLYYRVHLQLQHSCEQVQQKASGDIKVGGGGAERRWKGSESTESPAIPQLLGEWSYLERGHCWVPAIPVYGVELGRVVELMVQLRMSFASVHHFLEGKKGRNNKKNEPNIKKEKQGPITGAGKRAAVGGKMKGP